jgi:phosphoribosylformylglycinamidine (FGAM) synthase-like enzyme
MAVSAVDEALRNAVAVGADPDRIAILDNFCWGNPTYPDRLGSLVRACQGCYDAALAYRTPFISGKDSLYNEFNGQPIPGTLLISAIGIVPDMQRCVTSHLKQPGNLLYLLGETRAEFGGSLLHELLGLEGGAAPAMPDNPLLRYRRLHQAIRQGLVQSAHDCSEGGLAVALAEMALAGRLGAEVTLPTAAGLSAGEYLFSESNGRLLLEVAPQDAPAFEQALSGVAIALLGRVADNHRLRVVQGGAALLDLTVDELVKAWCNIL